ncbi:MYND-type domain-containing protein [Mycena indigotica]|uniref:MYND-type domain-containing protein n=1 Tax=Mycena indigotica TaxID=2126181 RepID=A0A8H6SU31_9AGAR|nr:MYND-type domain-containing protein [Mycena indigotica]KAF7306185.1 MYND-type domain-containing protein [Mycena indigotica]
MHDSLRLSKMHRLPVRLKIAAEKVLSRGAGMKEAVEVLAVAGRTTEHSALLLPVFYAMLDTAVIPELRAPGFVDENIDTARRHATCAVWGIDGVQRVTHVITVAAFSDIWRRCWPWVEFLTEYSMVLALPSSSLRTDTATPPGELPALWLRLLTRLLALCVTLDSAVIGQTRGFRVLLGEAWAHVVHVEPEDAACLQDVAVSLTLIMRSADTDIIGDIAEGAGGKQALATVIVGDLWNSWPDGTEPASSASLRRATSLFAFLRLALDNGLTEELQGEEIVAGLTIACASLSVATRADGMRTELMNDALSLLVQVLDGPWPQVRVAEAIETGLFAVLHTMTRWSSPANTTLLIKLFRDTLPPLLPLRPVAAVLQEALLEVRDMDSAMCIQSPERSSSPNLRYSPSESGPNPRPSMSCTADSEHPDANHVDAHFALLPEQHSPQSISTGAGPGPLGAEPTMTDDPPPLPSVRVTLRPCCFNCWTTESNTWRRSRLSVGKIVCIECGVFERKHSRPRPVQFPCVPPIGLVATKT